MMYDSLLKLTLTFFPMHQLQYQVFSTGGDAGPPAHVHLSQNWLLEKEKKKVASGGHWFCRSPPACLTDMSPFI